MSEILFHYHKINPTTWAYLSSLLMIGLFFKFGRFWSVRNLDLVLLMLLAPGLLLVQFGSQMQRVASSLQGEYLAQTAQTEEREDGESGTEPVAFQTPMSESAQQQITALTLGLEDRNREECRLLVKELAAIHEDEPAVEKALFDLLADYDGRGRGLDLLGYIWLFGASGLLLLRLLLDSIMVRRPLLEPNLSVGGLSFIGGALFLFLMANVIASSGTTGDAPGKEDLQASQNAEQLLALQETAEDDDSLTRFGPGYPLFFALFSGMEPSAAGKTMAVLGHLAIVVGVVFVGYWHFGNITTGIGVATLYLMLPYTALMTDRGDHVLHVLPAALLVWAFAFYRRPVVAGVFVALAAGVVYYPFFLLPLWCSFYWQRGLIRFLIGAISMLCLVVLSLIFTSSDFASFWAQFQQMFGLWRPVLEGLDGIWAGPRNPVYRIPVLAAFVVFTCSFALWPAQKNLGTLLSCSAAVMVATQFWHGHGGGTLLAWYLPLLLLTIFRPNLEDRVATAVVL